MIFSIRYTESIIISLEQLDRTLLNQLPWDQMWLNIIRKRFLYQKECYYKLFLPVNLFILQRIECVSRLSQDKKCPSFRESHSLRRNGMTQLSPASNLTMKSNYEGASNTSVELSSTQIQTFIFFKRVSIIWLFLYYNVYLHHYPWCNV